MKQYFELKEFIIDPDRPVPFHVCEKLVKHHLLPMNYIRNTSFNHPIIVSNRSGYRHPDYESDKGRSGSTHEFLSEPSSGDNGWGAADYTCSILMIPELVRIMIKESPYSRICFYPEANRPFLHCDYKFHNERNRRFYVSMEGKWIQGTISDLIESADKRANKGLK